MFKMCDLINVQSWHRGYFKHVRLSLAVYPPVNEETLMFNAKNFIEKILSFEVDKSKMSLVVTAFGKLLRFTPNFQLKVVDPKVIMNTEISNTTVFQDLGYNEICQNIKNGGFKTEWDDDQKAAHAYKGMDWMTYDNVLTIAEKMKLIMETGIGGVAVW